ncbi:MAG: CbtA family protein [Collimonas sp.]
MLSLKALKKIVFAAALAGMVAGLLLTGVQKIQVSPIILKAEVYEDAAAAQAVHAHPPAAATAHHEHEHGAWQPADGEERTLFTALANVSLAVGFGLLLGAAICLRGDASGWGSGLLWGLAGYVVFFIAPSLGLPPEVPGAEAAPLADRQMWWLMAVVMTAAGLSLLVFARNWKLKLLGAVLLGTPHLIGAPQPQVDGGAAPVELVHAFVYATAIANAIFWLALGGLVGFFYKKLA